MIGVLHTARINAIEFIVGSDKLIISLPTMNSIALILAVCRTPIIYELS